MSTPMKMPGDARGIEDRKGAMRARFCPLPEPGVDGASGGLDRLLYWIDRGLKLETVGIGTVGPYVPAIRPSRLDPAELARDFWGKYGKQRIASLQPWYPRPVNASNVAEVQRRRKVFEEQTKSVKLYPARFPSLAMGAAAQARLDGCGREEIATRFGLAFETVNHGTGRVRVKSVDRLIDLGDSLWGQNGGWPWAAFINADGEGKMPDDWHRRSEAEASLLTFFDAQAQKAQEDADLAANRARVCRWAVQSASASGG